MEINLGRRTRLVFDSIVLVLSIILFLELGSRVYHAGASREISLPPALVCDSDVYPPDPDKMAALEGLAEIHLQETRISADQLEEVLVAAPQEDMPFLNGTFCNGIIFVSQRLSPSARLYVARHELEHYFQIEGFDEDCQDWELCATWRAAREYPWGFVTIITSSLWESFRNSSSFWDFLFGSWTVFKIYFLP